MNKICGDCNLLKSIDDFHRRGKSYQSVCKTCRKIRDAGRQYDLDKKKVIQKRFIEWRNGLKDNKPCSDCKIIYPSFVMQWDHLQEFEKFKDVSNLWSKKLVLQEIKKCELVCANCHSMRTFNRNNNI